MAVGVERRYLRQELGGVLPVDQIPPSVDVGGTVVAAVNVVSVFCGKGGGGEEGVKPSLHLCQSPFLC